MSMMYSLQKYSFLPPSPPDASQSANLNVKWSHLSSSQVALTLSLSKSSHPNPPSLVITKGSGAHVEILENITLSQIAAVQLQLKCLFKNETCGFRYTSNGNIRKFQVKFKSVADCEAFGADFTKYTGIPSQPRKAPLVPILPKPTNWDSTTQQKSSQSRDEIVVATSLTPGRNCSIPPHQPTQNRGYFRPPLPPNNAAALALDSQLISQTSSDRQNLHSTSHQPSNPQPTPTPTPTPPHPVPAMSQPSNVNFLSMHSQQSSQIPVHYEPMAPYIYPYSSSNSLVTTFSQPQPSLFDRASTSSYHQPVNYYRPGFLHNPTFHSIPPSNSLTNPTFNTPSHISMTQTSAVQAPHQLHFHPQTFGNIGSSSSQPHLPSSQPNSLYHYQSQTTMNRNVSKPSPMPQFAPPPHSLAPPAIDCDSQLELGNDSNYQPTTGFSSTQIAVEVSDLTNTTPAPSVSTARTIKQQPNLSAKMQSADQNKSRANGQTMISKIQKRKPIPASKLQTILYDSTVPRAENCAMESQPIDGFIPNSSTNLDSNIHSQQRSISTEIPLSLDQDSMQNDDKQIEKNSRNLGLRPRRLEECKKNAQTQTVSEDDTDKSFTQMSDTEFAKVVLCQLKTPDFRALVKRVEKVLGV